MQLSDIRYLALRGIDATKADSLSSFPEKAELLKMLSKVILQHLEELGSFQCPNCDCQACIKSRNVNL